MLFKSKQMEYEFEGAPLFLKQIALVFDNISLSKFSINAVVTRILEPVQGESGVHNDYRAIDFRDEFNGKNLYSKEQADFLVNYINEAYPRNDGKATCIHHSFNGGPLHFHIQLAVLTKAYMPLPKTFSDEVKS